jgi:hypothetical protein
VGSFNTLRLCDKVANSPDPARVDKVPCCCIRR